VEALDLLPPAPLQRLPILPDLLLARVGDVVVSPGGEVVFLPTLLTHALSLSEALGDPVAETVPGFRPVADVLDPTRLDPLDNPPPPALLVSVFSDAVLVPVVLGLLNAIFDEDEPTSEVSV
jgi:hypothetical protein